MTTKKKCTARVLIEVEITSETDRGIEEGLKALGEKNMLWLHYARHGVFVLRAAEYPISVVPNKVYP